MRKFLLSITLLASMVVILSGCGDYVTVQDSGFGGSPRYTIFPRVGTAANLVIVNKTGHTLLFSLSVQSTKSL